MARVLSVPLTLLLAASWLASPVDAQVSFERLLNAEQEPHNWLTYSGAYSSNRHSLLDQITTANAGELELQWVFQAQSLQSFESTPLVVDGIMYLTEAPSTVVALDAKLGRVFWTYEHAPSSEARPCCGRINRGLAILDHTLFLAGLDAELIAIDAVTGRPVWQTTVADPSAGYTMTMAPLVVKDKVVVGIAGGEYGIRGFIAAYDAATGDEVWRFHTIPAPGEPGHETWPAGSDAWEHGGGATWLTARMIPTSISSTGAPAIRGRTGTPRSGWVTTCTPTRWWRSTPIPASSSGTSSSRRTTRMTTTRCRFPSWSTTRRTTARRSS